MNAKTIAVVLRYRDPRRAAAWLCEALGFTLDHITEAAPGTIDYISLSYGPSVVLVCPEDQASGDRGPPSERQTCYLTVEDIAAHYETAKAEGALLERKLERADDGSELYVCRDPEGHLWSIGTHAFAAPREAPSPPSRTRSFGPGALALATVLASVLTAGAVLILSGPATAPPQGIDVAATESDADFTTGTIAEAPLTKVSAREQEIAELRDDLASLQREHVGQAATLQRAKDELKAARADRAALQTGLAEAQSQVTRLQAEADAARKVAAAAESKLASLAELQKDETSSGDAAQEIAARATEALERERQAREQAEADLAAAKASHAEAESAREAALADREAAAARLKAIEDTKKGTAAALARTREALMKANADLKSAEARHLEAIAAKEKIIAALNAQLSAKATAGKTPPAKSKPKAAAARPQAPTVRKSRKPAAEADSVPVDDDASLDPAVLRRCGQEYYERC